MSDVAATNCGCDCGCGCGTGGSGCGCNIIWLILILCCCGGGGGSLPPEKKKLENPVIGKKTVKISGMHCEHCVKAVTEAINKIDGAAAKVNLSENEAVVSYDRELDDEQLRKIVKDAGYRVVSIK